MEIKVNENIVLKTFELNDVESRYKVIDENRKFLRRWLGWLDIYESSKDLIEYTKICQEKEKNKEGYTFGIYYLDKFVGCIDIKEINYRNKKCEIGYWLSENENRKGIMIKSCEVVINYIYDNIDLNKITILVATENFASQVIPQKLGFEKEGKLINNECLYGEYLDNYIFGMTRDSWEMQKNNRM